MQRDVNRHLFIMSLVHKIYVVFVVEWPNWMTKVKLFLLLIEELEELFVIDIHIVYGLVFLVFCVSISCFYTIIYYWNVILSFIEWWRNQTRTIRIIIHRFEIFVFLHYSSAIDSILVLMTIICVIILSIFTNCVSQRSHLVNFIVSIYLTGIAITKSQKYENSKWFRKKYPFLTLCSLCINWFGRCN